jgi:LacI family transcriptional regulator
MVDMLDKIGTRRPHGVIVKAPDTTEVGEAIDRLTDEGIPVVTYATDVAHSSRIGYVGIDNRAAGATAAYLIRQWLGEARGSVLVTLSSNAFRAEEEREMGFRSEMRRAADGPGRPLVEIAESDGLEATVERLVLDALDNDPEIGAVYSIGGGNMATLRAFEKRGRRCRVFIAHDLDEDNRALLRAGKISAVLHHDLRADANLAGRMILRAHGGLGGVTTAMSAIRVVTPHNMP